MSFDPARFQDQMHRYHNGDITVEEFAEFEAAIKTYPEARATYRQFCRLDTLLRRKSEVVAEPVIRISRIKPIMAIAAGFVALATIGILLFSGGNVAQIAATEDAIWSIGEYNSGDQLKKGTKLQLYSGKAQIKFNSGAITNLTGPAIFKVKGSNKGYLFTGKAESVADSPASKGFTVDMPIASAVDIGTSFRTQVNRDQSNLVAVSDGKVDVEIGRKRRPLTTGMALNIQAGNPTVIYQIEKGDETSAFVFPSLDSPSSKDYGDQSRGISIVKIKGRMGLESKADADRKTLTDGQAQTSSLSPKESFYFKGDEIGSIIFDLGSKVPVNKINTYSWHQNPNDDTNRQRAFQHYILWAFDGDEVPDISDTPAVDGWIRIAEVNSDNFFGIEDQSDRPPQLACSIEGAAGNIGKYRFLYFDIRTSSLRKKGQRSPRMQADHTLFGEIDIYVDED